MCFLFRMQQFLLVSVDNEHHRAATPTVVTHLRWLRKHQLRHRKEERNCKSVKPVVGDPSLDLKPRKISSASDHSTSSTDVEDSSTTSFCG